MTITNLKNLVTDIISDIRDNAKYPKESDIDFKHLLNIDATKDSTENFLMNFFKDIISFANGNGGILFLGFKEDKSIGVISDDGLNQESLEVVNKLDLSEISKKIAGLTKVQPQIDLQAFHIGNRKFAYLLVEKSTQVIVSNSDKPEYKIKKGQIWYRNSGGNIEANESTAKITSFIQVKANEASKEFMTIWSRLLPEMIDINPKEVLILNVADQKIYGFDKSGGKLAGGKIEVEDKSDTFKIILEKIQAGDIGGISQDDGKPLYRIVGDIVDGGDPISEATKKVKSQIKYSFSNQDYKDCLFYLGYITNKKIKPTIYTKNDPEITENGKEFVFRICTNQSQSKHDLRLSSDCTDKITELVKYESKHIQIFSRILPKPRNPVIKN